MEDFLKRMLVEREDLTGKVKRLGRVITDKPFRISDEELDLMKSQLSGMKTYLEALSKRIKLHES